MVNLRIAAVVMVLTSAINVPAAFASGNELYDDVQNSQVVQSNQHTGHATSVPRNASGTGPALSAAWWDDLGGRI